MLEADRAALSASVQQGFLAIREKELQLYNSQLNAVGTQVTKIAATVETCCRASFLMIRIKLGGDAAGGAHCGFLVHRPVRGRQRGDRGGQLPVLLLCRAVAHDRALHGLSRDLRQRVGPVARAAR